MTTNAQNGMDLMNRVHGREWVMDFSLAHFSILSTYWCVLGQHYGNYWDGLRELFGNSVSDDTLTDLSVEYGFAPGGAVELDSLQAEWEHLIRDQQEELMSNGAW